MAVEPRWITFEEAVERNAEQIALFGGVLGIKDANLIHSALAKPQNSFHYGREEDVLALAVELGVAIARNHGFADGNKRTGLVAMLSFLRLNGFRLDAPDDLELGRMLEAVLVRDMTEEAFADNVAAYVSESDD